MGQTHRRHTRHDFDDHAAGRQSPPRRGLLTGELLSPKPRPITLTHVARFSGVDSSAIRSYSTRRGWLGIGGLPFPKLERLDSTPIDVEGGVDGWRDESSIAAMLDWAELIATAPQRAGAARAAKELAQ